MGLEAESVVETEGETHTVKALLEGHELILRGAFRRTFSLTDISAVEVRDAALHFMHGGVAFTLRLPDGRAETWARKMTTPPPSLAAKLGISPDKPAYVVGFTDDPALLTALDGNTVATKNAAVQIVVVADSPDILPDPDGLPAMPVWIVYPKGAKSSLPESIVRTHMRDAGWSDTKTSAVSERLSALRFHKR